MGMGIAQMGMGTLIIGSASTFLIMLYPSLPRKFIIARTINLIEKLVI